MFVEHTDIDECDTGDNNCDANAICNNTIGEYLCTCQLGFTGNGTECSGMLNISHCVYLKLGYFQNILL